ncbi:MAG: hypothetical protein IT443_09340 [Phycisphaeraceae bacterium]|nr:hypothetical protein [Phycisphaeraceae bacterium]
MNRQQIALKLVLDKLGLKLPLDTFEGRLIIQKAIYLAQVKGVDLGYYFGWYLRGPYCPALTKDAFSTASEAAEDDESSSWLLDDKSARRLEQLQSVFGPTTNQLTLARRLELLASVQYLVQTGVVSDNNPQQITEELAKRDKNFTLQNVSTALQELRQNGFFPKAGAQPSGR